MVEKGNIEASDIVAVINDGKYKPLLGRPMDTKKKELFHIIFMELFYTRPLF